MPVEHFLPKHPFLRAKGVALIKWLKYTACRPDKSRIWHGLQACVRFSCRSFHTARESIVFATFFTGAVTAVMASLIFAQVRTQQDSNHHLREAVYLPLAYNTSATGTMRAVAAGHYLDLVREQNPSELVSLPSLDLSDAMIFRSSWDSVNFTDSIFTSATLNTVTFNGCRLWSTKWIDTHAYGTTFLSSEFHHNAVFENTRFGGATLRNTSFVDADLDHVDFSSGDLIDVTFKDSTITSADFTSTSMTSVTFSSCTIGTLNLTSSTLCRVRFNANKSFPDVILSGSRYDSWTYTKFPRHLKEAAHRQGARQMTASEYVKCYDDSTVDFNYDFKATCSLVWNPIVDALLRLHRLLFGTDQNSK